MALVKDYNRFNRLATTFNGVFGTTGPHHARTSSQSVKFELIDEHTVKIRYMTIVNFPSHAMQRNLVHKYRQDALEFIKAALKKAVDKHAELHEDKEDYKKLNWKLDENAIDEGFEFLQYSMHSPAKKAYFRVICVSELS